MKRLLIDIFCIIALFLLVSCSAQYGALKPDSHISRLFETGQVLPDHRYYYTGPESQPDAIMGIRNEYTLQTTMWKPVVMTPELLKRWMGNMLPYPGISFFNYGASIRDPSGKQVGVWYSYSGQTFIQFPGNGIIVVHKPPTRDDDAYRLRIIP